MQKLAVPFNQSPPILATGAMFKSTLCLIQNGEAHVSDVIGALDNPAALQAYDLSASELMRLATKPLSCVACDLHPDFYSTRFAENLKLPLFPVQHHHAHIAAVLAEHGIKQPTLGLALDGFGLGADRQSWGGELLAVDARGCRRVGRLRPLLVPGGDKAAREPWRMGAAALWELGRGDEIATRYAQFPQAKAMLQMLARRLNCPPTSSAGRLFDAACGLLGVKPLAAFEGEAPMELEKLAQAPEIMPNGWNIAEKDGLLELDLRPLLSRIADTPPQEGANLFHGTLIAALAAWVEQATEKTSLQQVAFGGGCFMNKVLRDGLADRMKMTVLQTQTLSPGDASISVGQAYAAAWAREEDLG
ncbi:MAG: hydrogenase maturation protein HypF [Alphaproteobacteria bacterium]|nr:hydrogenase maturation protein HypF [Alphaproteobacteria bacterium]